VWSLQSGARLPAKIFARLLLSTQESKGNIMSTQKEITYNVAYKQYHVDYDANYITYQVELADVEAAFKAAEYVAWEECDKKNRSNNWVHSKAEVSAMRREKDAAIATARKSRDAAKAFIEQAHTYAVVVLDAVLEYARIAAFDADAAAAKVVANVAHYRAAYDAKKIAADKAAESPDKVAADKIAYREFNDMSEASRKAEMAYLVKSHGGY